MLKGLLIACALALPATLPAYPGPSYFAGIEETADGGFLRVRLATTGDIGANRQDLYPTEIRAGHPDAYPQSGIYRHGEKTPLFVDDGWEFGCGPQIFMNQDGASMLLISEGETARVVFIHADGVHIVHRLPGRPYQYSRTGMSAGQRPPSWTWSEAGGVAVATSRSGGKFTFSPRTGRLLRSHLRQDNLAHESELAAFNKALGASAEPARKEDE